jgi:hypothetical protein
VVSARPYTAWLWTGQPHDDSTLRPVSCSCQQLPRPRFGCSRGDGGGGERQRRGELVRRERQLAVFQVSLTSQAAAKYGSGFSYCLPSSSSFTGYLSLGPAAPPNALFTHMLARRDTPSFYYLDLAGIKVAGRAVKVPLTVFAMAGTVID